MKIELWEYLYKIYKLLLEWSNQGSNACDLNVFGSEELIYFVYLFIVDYELVFYLARWWDER